MQINYLQNPTEIPLAYLPGKKGGRTFKITEAIEVTLSDGRKITIPKGFESDLSSIPQWLWLIFKPFDKALIADIIHDLLWVLQLEEQKLFKGSYQARKYSDEERNKWRMAIAPELKIKNWITHKTLRLVGGFFYSRQIKIPI